MEFEKPFENFIPENELPPNPFLSPIQQAKNLTKLVADTAIAGMTGQDMFVSAEIADTRLSICKECIHYSKEENRCRHCGCFLEHKTKFSQANCPINKW